MISKEKVIETKICKHCWISFDITDKDLEFYEKISPIFNWVKYNIPTPKLCPDCRLQRRLSFRNVRKLYKRKSSLSWNEFISMYKPDSWYTIYTIDEWWNDKNEIFEYGMEYNFEKTFFEQYNELLHKTPIPWSSLTISTIENSSYINWANNIKNSYLSFNMIHCDSVFYTEWSYYCNNLIDCYNVEYVDNSYECTNCKKVNWCFFSVNLSNSNNCYYCFDSLSLNDCIWCVNLSNKSYCIFNKQYSKEDYLQKKEELLYDLKLLRNLSNDFYKKQFRKENSNINNENSVWEYLTNTKNCTNCFNIIDGENLKNCFFIKDWWVDSYDISLFWQNMSKSYESVSIWNNANSCLFTFWTYDNVSNLIYCIYCISWCTNCFWCVWLKNKQYCIFNKQYSKEDYNKIVPKIIDHMMKTWEWWEYFPSSISPFWYNESTSSYYFLLTQEEAIKKWFNWSTYEPPFPNVEKIISANMLPDNISSIPDDILNRAIECEATKKPFRIIKQELDFYRKHNLPIPRIHPDERHKHRLNLLNWLKQYNKKCDKCWKDIKTTYSPLKKEIVYCESCYNKEVY